MLFKFIFLSCLVICTMGCSSVFGPSCEQPEWATRTMVVTGVGFPSENGIAGQQKLMAERASRISALSTMTVQIQNLPYNQGSVGEYLPIDWQLSGFSVDDVQHKNDGSCHTKVSLPLLQIWDLVQKNRK